MIPNINEYDYIILGSGIYGLYSASILDKKYKVLILEKDQDAFSRATFVNQARVHNGYHYPRSISTAIKSAKYFEKFSKDFNFAINNKFRQIYCISKSFSFTSGDQFIKFCHNAHIPCKKIYLPKFINKYAVESSFETEEYSFDAQKIKKYLLKKISKYPNVQILYSTYPIKVKIKNKKYLITTNSGKIIKSDNVINTTYASTNQISQLFNLEKFKIKYEICEIIICDVNSEIKNIGFTIMDGPFCSLMPFGLTGKHSLTSVTFTPHKTSHNDLPIFDCQIKNKNCTKFNLDNCNLCPVKPKTSWAYMSQIAKKYLNNININYINSYFAIKPILKVSEVDDSRPTVIKKLSNNPSFTSVLSGKINTIYDLDDQII